MEDHEHGCTDPNIRADIAHICDGDEWQELVDYYFSGEPGFIKGWRDHYSECAFCKETWPGALVRIEAILNAVQERALREIEALQKRFVAEFSTPLSSEGENWRYADRIAALATVYAEPAIWQLYFLLPEHYWKNFAVLPTYSESSEIRPIAACGQHLKALSSEALHFLFTAVLTKEAYRELYGKFWRMSTSSFLRMKSDGVGFESIDNPDYPIYQAYELKASVSMKHFGNDEEGEPFYGSAVLLAFIREKIRETLLETPLDYRVIYSALEEASTGYLRHFQEHADEDAPLSAGPRDLVVHPVSYNKLNEMHHDLADATDSIKAGQMEILRELQSRRNAREFLPLVESRLGKVYSTLHQMTQRLLARGEYFLSINQAEPDAMNVVVLDQAKACENELYMRIFGPFLLKLFTDGVKDYPADGTSKWPLIRNGKEQPRSLILSTYCWYLKNDSQLRSWIESTLHVHLPTLVNEAYWISDKRNLAAHEADFKQYDAAIFQARVYSAQGLLANLAGGAS
ncbi:MAG: hypothetical protein ACLQG3_11595 [Terracidiphilus sp.]